MLYYAAPMEGFTDRVWRQTHQKWFGAQGAADRYYAPFISPPENRVLIKKKMAELAPEANPGAPVIPQIVRAIDPAILPAPRIPMFMLFPPLWFGSIVASSADSVNTRGKRIQRKYAITVRKKAQPYAVPL